jgi:hypothetical protein
VPLVDRFVASEPDAEALDAFDTVHLVVDALGRRHAR